MGHVPRVTLYHPVRFRRQRVDVGYTRNDHYYNNNDYDHNNDDNGSADHYYNDHRSADTWPADEPYR